MIKDTTNNKSTVLILGNGFDLDMGRKTSYKDFYNSNYCPKDFPAPLIRHLNNALGGRQDEVKWYDLENELMNYYNSFKGLTAVPDIITKLEKRYLETVNEESILFGEDRNEYIQVFNDLIKKGLIVKDNRGAYIIPNKELLLQPPHIRDRQALQLIKEKLCEYLCEATVEEPSGECLAYIIINTLLMDYVFNEHTNRLHIYNFNYTPIPWSLGDKFGSIINYVHGICKDGKVIIGTGDTIMKEDYCFLQKAFDHRFAPPLIKEDLDLADDVVIFGHSLGMNDSQYLKPFFMKQSDYGSIERKRITIITKNDKSEEEVKRSLQQLTNNHLSVLMTGNAVRFIKTDLIGTDDGNQPLIKFLTDHDVSESEASQFIRALTK